MFSYSLSTILFLLVISRGKCLSTAVRKSVVGCTDYSKSSSRRSVLAVLSILSVAIPVDPCQAREEEKGEAPDSSAEGPARGGKPFAPPGALLPAARLKKVVDEMYDLSLNLPKNSNDKEVQFQTLDKLNQIWTTRPPLFLKNEQLSARSPTAASAQLTTGISSANKQQSQAMRKDLSVPDRVAAIFNQADVERQFGMLKYQESKREQGNELLAALNFYTSQLEFSNAYLLTASPEDRKRLIRNDQLPSLTAVIASDLDLRDLYRNDFLTALADANAEVKYQLKQSTNEVDVTDVVELMEKAHTSINLWFDLIAAMDVKDAMDVVNE